MSTGVSEQAAQAGRGRDVFPKPLDDRAGDIARTANSPARSADTVDPRTIYDAYRRQIEHEDNMIGQRTSWLLMAESFLVVGYCILHQLAPPDAAVQPVTRLLTALVGWLGLLSAAPIVFSVLAAGGVMCRLREGIEAERRKSPALDQLMTVLPPIQPSGATLSIGRMPAVVLPSALCLFWLTMIIASAAS